MTIILLLIVFNIGYTTGVYMENRLNKKAKL